MLNTKLHTIQRFIDDWCQTNDIAYTNICNEADLHGLFFRRQDRPALTMLVADLEPLLNKDNVHLETTKVRGGTVLAFSMKAITETQLVQMLAAIGEEREPMSFRQRLHAVFQQTTAVPSTPVQDLNEGSFLVAAVKIVSEAQYKTATRGITRSNQTSLQRQRIGSDNTLGGPQKSPLAHDTDDPQATTAAGPATTGAPVRFEGKVAAAFGVAERLRPRTFQAELTEALAGMATPTGAQPGDLFTKFAQSLAVLGQQMGTGPLQDQLKQQGINWKKSDDGQSIILYIVNAQTNAPQPIARIGAATLEKPSDFETQLLNIMDFAKGDAPGTFKQRQAELQAQEKAAREIAKQMGPPDQNAIAQQLGQQSGQPAAPGVQPAAPGVQPAAPGVQPQPTPAVQQPAAAAQQAATPKPMA